MKIERKLILYRSSQHQPPLKTNSKYGLIPHQIKFIAESQSRKCQERMTKTLGKKHIQAVTFIPPFQSEIGKRDIFCLLKLASFKTMNIEYSSMSDHTLKKFTHRIFSRYKHIQNFSTTSTGSSPVAGYFKLVQRLPRAQKLSFSQTTITSPEILDKLSTFFSTAYKRRIWPKLKALVFHFTLKFGWPFTQNRISSLNNLLQALKNPQFCPDPQIKLELSPFFGAPVHKSNCGFSDILVNSELISSLEVFFLKKFVNYYENLLQPLRTTDLQHIFLINMDPTHLQGVPLVPASVAKLKSLTSLELRVEKMQSEDCLIKTFDIISQLLKIQTFSLTFRYISFDVASLKALSNLIANFKSLQNLSLWFMNVELQNPEAKHQLCQFLRDLGSCTNLKDLRLDWTRFKYDEMINNNYSDYFFALCESLQNFEELKRLKIGYSSLPINEDCVQKLSQVFSSTTKIQALDLSFGFDKEVPYKNLLHLIKSIGNSRNLSELALSLALGDIDVEFAETLEGLIKSLKNLNLVKINLRSRGILVRMNELEKMTKRLENSMDISIF